MTAARLASKVYGVRLAGTSATPYARLMRLGSLVALVLVTVSAVVAYFTTTALVGDFAQVRHSREVTTDLIDLLSALKDAETGQRGYIITGKVEYLAPYTGARGTVTTKLDALRALTVDDPLQQQQLQQLQPLVDAKMAELDRAVALRRTQGFTAAAAEVSTDQGEDLMNQIRAIVLTMQTAASAREAMQTADTEAVARHTIVGRAFGGSLTVGLAVLAYVAIVRELRRRLTSEAALRTQYREADEARQETAAILNATNEGMVLLSPEGRVLSVNPRFSELFGLEADEIIGRRFHDLQGRVEQLFADPAAFLSLFDGQRIHGSPSYADTVTLRLPEQRDLHVFTAPVSTGEGDALGRLYVFRDVTKERAADRLKTEFVSLVSHELRTPLTSIKGYVDLLTTGEAGPMNADQLEFLGIVKNNADRLVSLINDLLDISRIEAGKVVLNWQPLSLGPLLQHVVTSLRPQMVARMQAVTLVAPADLPLLTGDVGCLTQVFTNLLSNASKYTPNGGDVRITASADYGLAQVNVTDSGIGMTPDELDQLFTKFFRSTHRLARDVGGTGLGLAICRSLVELHGGQIAVRSSPGHGSTFSVYLPIDGAGQLLVGHDQLPAVAVAPG
jgi:PAS domain S-box-containing protein